MTLIGDSSPLPLIVISTKSQFDLELHGSSEALTITSKAGSKESYDLSVDETGGIRVDGWVLRDLIRAAVHQSRRMEGPNG